MTFEYLGGDPALDLVNTVDWTARGPAQERLAAPEDLVRWGEGAGIVSRAGAERLRRAVARHLREGARALEHAHEARRALRDLFAGVAAGAPPREAVDRFNRLLAGALERASVAPPGPGRGGSTFHWVWRDLADHPSAIIGPVLWSAARLLTSPEAGRIRVCGGGDCGWMYVDRSRNGLRRWCQMSTCGTREKTRRRREGLTA